MFEKIKSAFTVAKNVRHTLILNSENPITIGTATKRFEEEFEIDHGITLWAHNALGLTIARDSVYYGKPITLPLVIVSEVPPEDDVIVGQFWLDTAGDRTLKTYRDDQWIEVPSPSRGMILYDDTNHRLIIKIHNDWHYIASTKI